VRMPERKKQPPWRARAVARNDRRLGGRSLPPSLLTLPAAANRDRAWQQPFCPQAPVRGRSLPCKTCFRKDFFPNGKAVLTHVSPGRHFRLTSTPATTQPPPSRPSHTNARPDCATREARASYRSIPERLQLMLGTLPQRVRIERHRAETRREPPCVSASPRLR